MSNGFVIGNGRSRRNFQLEKLKGHGVVVGCNALYRDTYVKNKWDLPDYLVAIDPTIIEEIKESEFPQQRFVVPPEEEQWEPVDYHLEMSGIDKRGLMLNNPGLMEQITTPRSNAGMNAMQLAIRKGAKTVYLLGFDFILATDQSTSNLYEGTHAYGPETAAGHSDSVNRTKYMNWFAERNPDVAFVFVLLQTDKQLNLNPITASNIRGMFYKEFTEEVLGQKKTLEGGKLKPKIEETPIDKIPVTGNPNFRTHVSVEDGKVWSLDHFPVTQEEQDEQMKVITKRLEKVFKPS